MTADSQRAEAQRRSVVGVENTQWKELYSEVVQTGLCTGCAACVMACPRDVLGYDHANSYQPFNIEPTTIAADCVHGERGCDICTRACPRFRDWELDADNALFGRARRPDEPIGIYRNLLLVRATEDAVHDAGQDGGLVSALLIWALESGRIDGALVSDFAEDRPLDAVPAVVTDRAGVLRTAGSRYTYSANPLAMREAEQRKLKALALVGMSCQASINGTVQSRNIAKYNRKIAVTIGLLCSKTFTYDGMYVQKLAQEHFIPLESINKVNIKGKFIVWHGEDNARVDIPLKECHAHTRPGCTTCPDFAAQHADISTGGLGQGDGWTLTIVRTQRGVDWIEAALAAGVIEARSAEEDPAAVNLMNKLAVQSRKRWPAARLGMDAGEAAPGVAVLPPPLPIPPQAPQTAVNAGPKPLPNV
ncbi:MAG TPA: Coenzyme F420 hydrogenase/dehydrogenase, beta subunit C-terminal domain [Mycobacteriales bacterium]|nr:Coenzyme F420 hydrogenase/dehydrogenase, beta subunit C-terminal domain [Mycobacteriales bacterium]